MKETKNKILMADLLFLVATASGSCTSKAESPAASEAPRVTPHTVNMPQGIDVSDIGECTTGI